MKTPKTFGLILILAIGAGGALLYALQPSRNAVQSSGQPPTLSPGAALVQVKLPAALSAKAEQGKTYFDAVCAACHGANAAGQQGVAPSLVHKIYEPSHHGDAAFMVAVRNGARQHHWSFGSMMPVEQPLSNAEIGAIIRYVRELQRENGIF